MMRLLLTAILMVFVSASVAAEDIVPDFELIRTKNGVPVYFFKSEKVPIFEVVFSFARGGDHDPVGQTGITLMSSQMLSRGAGGLSEQLISYRMDDLAAVYNFNVGEERTSFSVSGLNEKAQPIIDFFFTLLKKPEFPEAPFRRTQRNLIDQIQQIRDSASSMADHVSSLMVLEGSRKGRPVAGYLRDLRQLKPETLKRFFADLARPDLLRVLIVGGADKSLVVDPVVKQIEEWDCPRCGRPVEAPPLPVVPKTKTNAPVVVLDRPGIGEAHVRLAFIGPPRNHPEFFELEVAEAILAGPFGSRLNQAIREDHNLSYSVSAAFNYSDNIGTFMSSAATKATTLAVLLTKLRQELSRFAAGTDITEDEVLTAKNYLLGSFPLQLHNRYIIARMFFGTLLSGLPEDFLDHYRDRLRGVDLKGVQAAVKKHFHLPQAVTVVVGDLKVIGPVLKKAKIPYRVEKVERYL